MRIVHDAAFQVYAIIHVGQILILDGAGHLV